MHSEGTARLQYAGTTDADSLFYATPQPTTLDKTDHMSNPTTQVLGGILRTALAIGILAVFLLALFVAWWIALIAVAGWIIYSALRRMLGGNPVQPDSRVAGTIIEGEFQVEKDSKPDSRPVTIETPEDPPRR